MSIFGSKKNQTVSYTAPVIASFRVQTAVYGRCVTLLWGRTRISANLIWIGPLIAIPHTSVSSAGGGGKGGGGAPTSSSTTYTYEMAVIFGLCSGVIEKIGTVWKEKAKIDWPGGWEPGDRPQDVWDWLQSNYPAQALAYSGLALAYDGASDLGDNATLPNYSFEIFGPKPFDSNNGIWEANPKDFISDFLTNPYAGVGFPAGKLAALTQFSNFCVASGLFLSPALEDQKEAQEILTKLCQLTNSAPVWQDDRLDIMPLADEEISGHGVTYTPNNTPVYDLNDADYYYEEGQDPVSFEPADPADAFNQVKLEYLDKDNNYDTAIADPSDLAAVQAYGLRCADPIEAHWITDSATAWKVARLILWAYQFLGGVYKFRLTQKHILLGQMDLATLTDVILGLDQVPVRIKRIDEDENKILSFEAAPYLAGVAAAAVYPHQAGSGLQMDWNVAPGNVNQPLIFEPPVQFTARGFELWIAASGGVNWGGCEVWGSIDNITFQRLGRITVPSRTGWLQSALPAGADPDTVNTLHVDLTESRGELLSASQEDVDALATLSYVDGELVAYRDAALTATYKYDLTYLRRGCNGTPSSEHLANSRFVRLDQRAIFKYFFAEENVGRTIYLKFLSYNIFGGAIQSLGDVGAYQYLLGSTGGLGQNLPDPQNLTDSYRDGRVVLKWDEVDDPLKNYRSIEYEIRYGPVFAIASVVGRTRVAQFPSIGDGVYWVATRYGSFYCPNPASITLTGSTIPANIVQTYDEYALGWPGTKTGGVYVHEDGSLRIAAQSTYPYTGTYEIPAGHIVDLGTAKPCGLSQSYLSQAIDPTGDFDAYTDVDAVADIDGLLAGKADIKVQIALSVDGVNWEEWRDYVTGQYLLQKVKWRLLFTVSDGPATPVVSAWNYTLDMPDRIENVPSVTCPAGGLAVAFTPPFQATPAVAVAILNSQPGDTVVFLVAVSVNGYTVQIQNGGSGVQRNLSLIHAKY